jgi:hypothetical protein
MELTDSGGCDVMGACSEVAIECSGILQFHVCQLLRINLQSQEGLWTVPPLQNKKDAADEPLILQASKSSAPIDSLSMSNGIPSRMGSWIAHNAGTAKPSSSQSIVAEIEQEYSAVCPNGFGFVGQGRNSSASNQCPLDEGEGAGRSTGPDEFGTNGVEPKKLDMYNKAMGTLAAPASHMGMPSPLSVPHLGESDLASGPTGKQDEPSKKLHDYGVLCPLSLK